MSTSSDDAKALTTEVLAPEAVAAFLERNPGFLNDRPALMSLLVPPNFDHGNGVLDMQMFMLDRLRGQLTHVKSRERALLETAEANARVQHRVHRAIRTLLAARSFEALIRGIVDDLPELFDIAAAALCIETEQPLSRGAGSTGLVLLSPDAMDRMADAEEPVTLRPNTEGDEAIFGARAGRIRSIAVLQLDFGSKAPRGMLVLGSAAPDGFDPAQSTDLLAFFAFVMQRCVRRWLNDGP
jgi:uncharacterized protein YigA (DUF484 family)